MKVRSFLNSLFFSGLKNLKFIGSTLIATHTTKRFQYIFGLKLIDFALKLTKIMWQYKSLTVDYYLKFMTELSICAQKFYFLQLFSEIVLA